MAILKSIGRLFRRRVSLEPAMSVLGRPRLTVHDTGQMRCTACSLCVGACPSHCIQITAAPRPIDSNSEPALSGDRMPETFELDLSRCVLCGLCVEACPVDALHLDGDLPAYATGRDHHRLDANLLKIL